MVLRLRYTKARYIHPGWPQRGRPSPGSSSTGWRRWGCSGSSWPSWNWCSAGPAETGLPHWNSAPGCTWEMERQLRQLSLSKVVTNTQPGGNACTWQRSSDLVGVASRNRTNSFREMGEWSSGGWEFCEDVKLIKTHREELTRLSGNQIVSLP